jgi:hypothetical protein
MHEVTRSLAALAALAMAGECPAHHSFAMFDQSTTVTLFGTVKEFQWTNPHCFVQLVVAAPDGHTEEWSIEMNSPGASYREGYRPGALKAGDTVTVVINPIRDGTYGGRLVSAVDAHGRPINEREP